MFALATLKSPIDRGGTLDSGRVTHALVADDVVIVSCHSIEHKCRSVGWQSMQLVRDCGLMLISVP
jgi:hypothetical protein